MEIVATGYGEPDVLRAIETPARSCGKDEVAIAARAAGVNPRDLKSYADRDYATSRGQAPPAFRCASASRRPAW